MTTSNEESPSTESLDAIKIYIIILSAFCVLCIVGIVYNQYTLSQYKMKLEQGEKQLEKILEFETKIVSQSTNVVAEDIPDFYQFFKRFANSIPEPEITEEQLETRTKGDAKYTERKYVIRFDQGVNRRDLVEYIYRVIEAKPYLTLKQLDLQKLEGTPPYQDSWKGQLVFAFRKMKSEE